MQEKIYRIRNRINQVTISLSYLSPRLLAIIISLVFLISGTGALAYFVIDGVNSVKSEIAVNAGSSGIPLDGSSEDQSTPPLTAGPSSVNEQTKTSNPTVIQSAKTTSAATSTSSPTTLPQNNSGTPVVSPAKPVVPTPSNPIGGGKPSASNTGVPAGHNLTIPTTDISRGLTVYANGNVKITKSGTFENLLIKGRLDIKADNVTIRYSRIEANPNPWDLNTDPTSYSQCQALGAGTFREAVSVYDNKNLLVEDSEIAVVRKSIYISNGIHGSGYTLRRVNISGSVDGIGIFNKTVANVLVENSFIHDLYAGPYEYGRGCTPSHSDGIQIHYGDNITIRNNTLRANTVSSTNSNAGIMINQASSYYTSGVTISNNWIDYGACSINVHDGNKSPTILNLAILNNQFGRHQTYSGCAMIVTNATKAAASNNFSGNIWEDGGSPLPQISNGG